MIAKHGEESTNELLTLLKKEKESGKDIIVTSGYFDPIHPGHISLFKQCKDITKNNVLVVVLNGDNQCVTKKGKAFMPAIDRAKVLQELKSVDHIYIYDNTTDTYSNEALEVIKPDIYAKGGDWVDPVKLPETPVCEKHNIKIVFNIGDPKEWSSSDFLKDWVEFANNRN